MGMTMSSNNAMANAVRKSAYKKTLENWGGSYAMENSSTLLLEVTLRVVTNTIKVAVWGNDDGGMEKYFETTEEADICFNKLMTLEKIAKNELLSMGFDYV